MAVTKISIKRVDTSEKIESTSTALKGRTRVAVRRLLEILEDRIVPTLEVMRDGESDIQEEDFVAVGKELGVFFKSCTNLAEYLEDFEEE